MHGIAKAFLSSVEHMHCDKTKETCATFLHHMKERLSQFSDTKKGW